MILSDTILPGARQQQGYARWLVWVYRLSRAVAAEAKQLPAQPPPLPWPVRPDARKEIRQHNSGLFPKFPVKKPRVYTNTYVPKTVDTTRARTEVYWPGPEPGKNDNWLWRIRMCWNSPRPWEIDALVDPGGARYLPFFREVTIRLPLKAKICRELKAGKDGRWSGKCDKVKKLNAREPIVEATKWLLESGQAVKRIDNGQLKIDSELRTAGRPNLNRTNHPQPQAALPLLGQGGELLGAARSSAAGTTPSLL
jgi:hypothetical protein